MATKHSISHADQIYVGGGYDPGVYAANGRVGVPANMLTKVTWVAPAVADADLLIVAATSTELPNNATKTYTPATNGSSPTDNAAAVVETITTSTGASATVWTLDAARNWAATTTAAAADTVITVTGYDVYKVKVVETTTIATAASAGAGSKAFKYIESIAIYSAGDVTTDTVNIGTGSKLGFPYKVADKSDCLRVTHTGAWDDSAVVVAAVTTTATATTGDVRGTVTPNSALDGHDITAFIYVADPNTATGLRGVNQYGG